MVKSRLAKAFILSMCISMFSSGIALAASGEGQSSPSYQGQGAVSQGQTVEGSQGHGVSGQIQPVPPEATQEWTVTDEGKSVPPAPAQGYATDPNQSVSSGGMQGQPADGNWSVSSDAIAYPSVGGAEPYVGQGAPVINEDILRKQNEIDQYVFKQHVDEIAAKGFKVTYTGPFESYVEIGITPFSQDNADYLYSIFGKDMVKVVEGQQAVLLNGAAGSADAPDANITAAGAEGKASVQTVASIHAAVAPDAKAAVDTAGSLESASAEEESSSSIPLPLIIGLGAAVLLGGGIVAMRRLKAAKV